MTTLPVPSTRADMRADIIARQEELAPVVEFDEFLRWFRWLQGQHIGIVGPTGQGKSTFALAILEHRKYVVALGTKPKDETLQRFADEQNYVRYYDWSPEKDAKLYPHRLLWPDATDLYSAMRQRKVFRQALDSMYRQGNWTIYIDELWYIIHHLKLEPEIRVYLLQARSNGVSLVVATQRPAFVPLEVYDQSSWLIFFRDNDETNLKRIAGISWLSKHLVQSIVARLDQYQALAINTRTGEMVRTTAPARKEG